MTEANQGSSCSFNTHIKTSIDKFQVDLREGVILQITFPCPLSNASKLGNFHS